MILYLPASRATLPSSGAAQKILVHGSNFSWTELRYDDSLDEKAFFQFHIPDNYNGGDVIVRIPWKAVATSGNVLFAVGHRGVGDDSVWDAAGTIVDFTPDAAKGTTEDLNIASKTLVAPWAPGQLIQITPIRKGTDVINDTMSGDAKVVGVSLELGLA